MGAYRWLDDSKPVVSVAAAGTPWGWLRGKTGRILQLPKTGAIGNVLVDFEGWYVVCPAGTLRHPKEATHD